MLTGEQQKELLSALKTIYIWSRNPTDNVLKDLKLIEKIAERTLKDLGVLS